MPGPPRPRAIARVPSSSRYKPSSHPDEDGCTGREEGPVSEDPDQDAIDKRRFRDAMAVSGPASELQAAIEGHNQAVARHWFLSGCIFCPLLLLNSVFCLWVYGGSGRCTVLDWPGAGAAAGDGADGAGASSNGTVSDAASAAVAL